jgi:hypothetical protein|tara:strand:- start:236 stop:1021 length:786 start_codon:yes stop_codon:yes gene_type:complete
MKIISLGLGVQSTAMYLMSSLGQIDRADHAIFADPGGEHPDTYKNLDTLKNWSLKNDGISTHTSNDKNLLKDLIKGEKSTGQRFAGIPAFSPFNRGMVRRQCTAEYKIKPVMKKIRELHGLKKYQRNKPTEMWLGISLDEIQRMKESLIHNIKYVYPLIEKRFTRKDCINFYKQINFPVPPKSTCVFCPYHGNRDWKRLKQESKNEWDIAVKVDKAIRKNLIDRGLDGELFLHRSMKPLEEAYLQEDQEELFMCEEGYCGI